MTLRSLFGETNPIHQISYLSTNMHPFTPLKLLLALEINVHPKNQVFHMVTSKW
jgi:hypothetical protein